MTLENERLKLQLSERERALCNIQRSMSVLEQRLSVMSMRPSHVSLTADDQHQHASELESLNQALHNIAREVC